MSKVGSSLTRGLRALVAPGSRSRREPGPLVRLVDAPPRPAATPVERLAVAALGREGALAYTTLVERVADRLYREELRMGLWAADIGLWGKGLFLTEIAREIDAAAGLLWRIEDPAVSASAAKHEPGHR